MGKNISGHKHTVKLIYTILNIEYFGGYSVKRLLIFVLYN